MLLTYYYNALDSIVWCSTAGMTTIGEFIDGIPDLEGAQKLTLKELVGDGQFGARLEQICKPYHLRALQNRLPGLPFTDGDCAIVQGAIAGMMPGESSGGSDHTGMGNAIRKLFVQKIVEGLHGFREPCSWLLNAAYRT